MKIDFKLYADEDKTDVLEMMIAFNKIDGYDFNPIIGAKNLLEFSSNDTLGRLYLIRHQQQNIGYIILTFGFSFEYKGRDAFIDEFFIKETLRNKGIGKKAMDFIESESKKLNIKAVHLEVEAHNTIANQLYINKGYKSNERTLLTKKIITNTSVD